MLTGRYFAMLVMVSLSSQGIYAERAPMTESQRQGALFLDTLSIPSSGEIFASLHTSCHPNWVTLVSSASIPVTTDRPQLALVLGILTANGYIAVQAQDGPQVKSIGREIISVAKALGVSGNLMGRGSSLIGFAEKNAWDSLADELEATENEVKKSMLDQKDHDLVVLTSAAAWLRGLEVATQIALADDSGQSALLIRQPEIAMHLASQLDTLSERIKKEPLVASMKQILSDAAQQLSAVNSNPVSDRAELQRIHDEAAMLVKTILTSSNKKQSAPAAASTPAQTHGGTQP